MSIYITHADLKGLERCPQCNVAKPHLSKVWGHNVCVKGTDNISWGAFLCSSCNNLVFAKSARVHRDRSIINLNAGDKLLVENVYPRRKQITSDLPDSAKTYLKQALDSLHAPDGAVMLCASAVDSMLKDKGYEDGWLNDRITKAAEDGLFTKDMAEWAHMVRLEANNPRHADKKRPHMSTNDAEQALTFANALGMVLYELPAKIALGKESAAKRKEDNKAANEA
ncbi:MAG: DUF4145 domain-containing protein [Rhodospirillales bacterium]|nr:DUF4145 domain-containing protein [Rhodospirillales bacterium]